MLNEACPEDPFGVSRTPLHTSAQLDHLIRATNWQKALPADARAIGKLITAAGSLVHGLYNDVVTDFAWDTYGPYENVAKKGQNYTLLVRRFPDLRPAELWPAAALPGVGNIEIRQLYQNVSWALGFVGCHTMVMSGDPSTGLKFYAVHADGKSLSKKIMADLTYNLARNAEVVYAEIKQKNFEQLKELVMLQECYQLRLLFAAAGLDWRPTAEMLAMIRQKKLLANIVPLGEMMTSIEQYVEAFSLRRFAREVHDEII